MSDSDHAAPSDVLTRIESWVTDVDAGWERLGIPVRARRLLAADLTRDLEATAATGVELDHLLDPDVARFAEELALANGFPVDHPARRSGRPEAEVTKAQLIWSALAGGLLGAVFSWWVIFPLGVTALSDASAPATAITLDGASAVATAAGAVAMVRWRLHGRPDLKRAVLLRLATGLCLGGLLSVAPTMLLAQAWGYSTAPIVLLAEAAFVASFCAAGIAIALHQKRPVRGLLGTTA